ncbi:MAG: hypothetical protein HKN23_08580, partial [Verrucomicrobiales bacterium]|nr:hypothetical protein [Verrucomicrobiales bacterium]
ELAKLVQSQPDDKKLIEEIYYRVLNRSPKPGEIEAALASMAEIDGDHQELVKNLAQAEADWVGKKSELEIARIQRINKAKADVEAYMPEYQKKKAAAEADRNKRIAEAKKAMDARAAELPKLTDEFTKNVKADQFWTKWNLLPVTAVTASDKSEVKVQPDGSVRSMVGYKKRNLDYLITSNTKVQNITGILIESVPDLEFGAGPGLNPNGNFVISEVQSRWNTIADPKKNMPLAFADAKATFNQQGFNVKNSINGKVDRGQKGWALAGADYKIPHRAIFKFKEPFKGDPKGAQLIVGVLCRYSGGEYPIGRFRVYYTTDADPMNFGLPANIATAVQTAPAARTDAQKKALAAYVAENDADLMGKKFAHQTAQKPVPADPEMNRLNGAITLAERPIKEDSRLLQLRQDMSYSVQQAANRRLTTAQDLAWALINSPSFLFNR